MKFSDDALTLLQLLGETQARFVGGAVRDAQIGRAFTDVDIATTHTPEQVMNLLTAHDIKVIPTGIEHGTVTAVLNGKPYEITTLRKDVACDGRHAEVTFTDDWQEDAARRDFTMNALYLDVSGKLYDFFNGLDDLNAGVVRFVGNAENRIQEDYLRILRLFRFHAHYGKGEMLAEQLAFCKKHILQVLTLSGERIQQEMLKLLKAKDVVPVLTHMNAIGLLPILLQKQTVSLKLLEAIESKDPFVRLASMLGDNSAALAGFWKLSNAHKALLMNLCMPQVKITKSLDDAAQKKALRAVGAELFEQLVLLAQAQDPSGKATFQTMLKLAKEWQIPEFPLTGKDILALGVPAGKQVGELLKQTEEYWEENHYQHTKDALIAFLKL